jgi:uncharacterized glyoxalase superfamily protein PhnB/MOSC domain-containing protein YiiM
MKVEHIFISAKPGGPQVEQELVHVTAGSGIKGDRYFGQRDEPGQNLTLIEIEEIEAFLREYGRADELSVTSRNILTRGVRLNDLVGVEFWVGEVKLRGVELCEPCLGLGTALSSPTLSPAAVVKRFAHRAGLRADVLSSGVIKRGAAVTLPPALSAKEPSDQNYSRGEISVKAPKERINPLLVYKDIQAAHEFLVEAFGFEPGGVERDTDGQPIHGEVRAGASTIWLHRVTEAHQLDSTAMARSGLVVYVADVDSHYRRARAAGAHIDSEPTDMPYGQREYGARDLEGHRWWFATPQKRSL